MTANIDIATLKAITVAAFATLPRLFQPATAITNSIFKASAGRVTFRRHLKAYNNACDFVFVGRYAYLTTTDAVVKDLAWRGHDVRKISGDAFMGRYVIDQLRPVGTMVELPEGEPHRF